ncbi:MAG: hypothetical protein J4G12_00415 [Gemmatimonadetes bacterium]|nr:hypothetical protein [Gemmatimonadota bacterium]
MRRFRQRIEDQRTLAVVGASALGGIVMLVAIPTLIMGFAEGEADYVQLVELRPEPDALEIEPLAIAEAREIAIAEAREMIDRKNVGSVSMAFAEDGSTITVSGTVSGPSHRARVTREFLVKDLTEILAAESVEVTVDSETGSLSFDLGDRKKVIVYRPQAEGNR